jgi:hypothetical protein
MAKPNSKDWFFIRTTLPGESTDSARELEIQILDDDGTARASGYCRREANEVRIDGESVPRAVLDSARRLSLGLGGQYVDSAGKLLSFQGEPLEWPAPLSTVEAAEQILEVAIRLHQSRVPGWKERLNLLAVHYSETEAARKAAQLLRDSDGA